MPYGLYRAIHYVGAFLAVASIAPLLFHGALGGDKSNNPWRRQLAIGHGIGLLLLLLGGFGMLAKIGMTGGLPGWATAKLVIWLLLGGFTALAYRARTHATQLWCLLVALAVTAAFLGWSKPF